jgi:hypothetical protein
MNNKSGCLKCNGEMVRGFCFRAFRSSIEVASIEKWYRGEPEKSFSTGIEARKSIGLPISVFRCKDCGFLEYYAEMKFSTQ